MPETKEQPQRPLKIDYELISSEVISILSIILPATIVWASRSLRAYLKRPREILPRDEIKRVSQLLAQLAYIYQSDRVALGVFHNGVIGAEGAHYEKFTVIEAYSAPGITPLPELKKTVFINEVPFKSEGIISRSSGQYKLYMSRRDIFYLKTISLSLGDIEIGIISIHWCSNLPSAPNIPPDNRDIEEEIISIIQSAR